jgi:hypothetical protein
MSDSKADQPFCIIKQPAGIGDILFCQKIAKIIQTTTNYKKIIWPVRPVYKWLNEYLVSPGIEFCGEDEEFLGKDLYQIPTLNTIANQHVMVVPLATSDSVLGACKCHNNPIAHGHMKYNFVNIEYDDWLDYFDIKRNYDREAKLCKLLGLDDNSDYVVINRNYGTYPGIAFRHGIEYHGPHKAIELGFIDGVRIFDWLGVLERAQAIYSVETAIWYLLAKLGYDNLTLYTRHPTINDDFSYMRSSARPSWQLINT